LLLPAYDLPCKNRNLKRAKNNLAARQGEKAKPSSYIAVKRLVTLSEKTEALSLRKHYDPREGFDHLTLPPSLI